jgi:RES domain-containing protein
MVCWRLCRRPFADLSGDGARLYGGRWNSPGRPVVYLAEHPALAALEVRVHLDLPLELIPSDYVLMRVMVPDAPFEPFDVPADTAAFGNAWLSEARGAALRVPSVLMPHSWNILLNPRHPDASQSFTIEVEPFAFDPRLWQPMGSEGSGRTTR